MAERKIHGGYSAKATGPIMILLPLDGSATPDTLRNSTLKSGAGSRTRTPDRLPDA